MNIGDLLQSKKNNFNFVRLIASISVIFSHSFVLSLAEKYNGEHEPLFQFTNRQISIGTTCVYVFFIISGLLITRSFDRTKDLKKYTKARVLRIYPALFVAVFLTTFIMGPIVTSKSIIEYFSSSDTWWSLKNCLVIFGIHHYLPGVFESNFYAGAVNGSLWTLQLEIFCYGIVGILGFLKILNKYTSILIFIFTLSLNMVGVHYLDTLLYFSVGMMFYFLRYQVKVNFYLSLLSSIILVIGTYFGHFNLVAPLTFTYLVLYIRLSPRVQLPSVERIGDLSYGIYIFAFPIQQLLINYLGEMNPFTNFFFTLLFVLPLAIISWNIIEKPSLKFK